MEIVRERRGHNAPPWDLCSAPGPARGRGSLVLYFVALVALGGHDRWGRLGVPPASVKFLDLRNVIAAWKCDSEGIAVLPINPCDPYHRPADFPKIWLALSFLGIGQGGAVALGVGIAVVFLVCAIFVVPAGVSAWTGLAYAAALCSPAVMLGIERGNPDILIFPLVLAAALLTTRTRTGQILTAALLLFVIVLKLYPAFAAGYLVRRATRASLTVLAVVAACSLVYVLATYHYIHEMLSSIPQSNVLTYGVRRRRSGSAHWRSGSSTTSAPTARGTSCWRWSGSGWAGC